MADKGASGSSRRRQQRRRRQRRVIDEEYIRRFEEGELIPTPEELAVFEHAYQMNPAQRKFFRLLYRNEVDGPVPIPDIVVTAEHRRRVDAHAPNPAALLDHRWNVVYANTSYLRVLRGLPAEGGNFVDWLFRDDNARSIVLDHAAEARHLTGRFRFTVVAYRADPEVLDLMQRCYADDDLFAAAWDDAVFVADGPAATPMHWRDPDTGHILRVTEEALPDSEFLTLQLAVPAR